MGQFSVEIPDLPGSVLSAIQQTGACAGAGGGGDAWPCADPGHKATRTAAVKPGASADSTS